MDVAVRGDRTSCLSVQLRAQTYLFAIADGFGMVDGEPAARLTLVRLREAVQRRSRRGRIGAALAGALGEVNAHLQARSASHADYVTAACSITAMLVAGDRAHVAHAGSTSAYLVRRSRGVALTKSDTFCEEDAKPVLTRALGLAPAIDLSLGSFSLCPDDLLVLRTSAGDRSLMVRYSTPVNTPISQARLGTPKFSPAITTVGATVLFYALLCLK